MAAQFDVRERHDGAADHRQRGATRAVRGAHQHHGARLPAPPRPDRGQGRLRRGGVRSLLGPGRATRRSGRDPVDRDQRLPGAGRLARRAGGRHRRGARRPGTPCTRSSARWPCGVARSAATARPASCAAWPPSSTAPAGRPVTRTASTNGTGPIRRRRPRARTQRLRPARHERQPLPLHRLPPDPRRGLGAGPAAGRRPAGAPALQSRRPRPSPPGSTGPTEGSPGRPTSPRRSRCSPIIPDATVVAGSTDWGVEVNIRGSRAAYAVAIDRLPELRELIARRRLDPDRRRAHPVRGRGGARRRGARCSTRCGRSSRRD